MFHIFLQTGIRVFLFCFKLLGGGKKNKCKYFHYSSFFILNLWFCAFQAPPPKDWHIPSNEKQEEWYFVVIYKLFNNSLFLSFFLSLSLFFVIILYIKINNYIFISNQFQNEYKQFFLQHNLNDCITNNFLLIFFLFFLLSIFKYLKSSIFVNKHFN